MAKLGLVPDLPLYDVEREPDIPVEMNELEWSLVVVQLRKSPIAAVRDCADKVSRQVRLRQQARRRG